jgi:hypothetical protein
MRHPSITFALLAFTAPAFVACSSADPDASSDYLRPTVDEPVSYTASEETKKETGVVVWGGDIKGGAARIVGYDAHGAKVALFEQREVPVDAHHHSFETTLKTSGVDAVMHFDGTVGRSTRRGTSISR